MRHGFLIALILFLSTSLPAQQNQPGTKWSDEQLRKTVDEAPLLRDGTGLAGGIHVHFSMQIDGVQTNPREWWDEHWIKDRVLSKLQ